MSERVDWETMCPNRWLELFQLAKEEANLDLMVGMIRCAFRGERRCDPRIARHMMQIADVGTFTEQRGCGCKTCVFPDVNGGPKNCPRMQIQAQAMKAIVFDILNTPCDHVTDRGRNNPMEHAPYNANDGALLLELISFVHRNADYLLSREEGYREAIRSFLDWINTFMGTKLDDPLPLLDSMIYFGLEDKIRWPTPKFIDALERIVATDTAGGQLAPMTPGQALICGMDPHTIAAAERWAILHVKAETRDKWTAHRAPTPAETEAPE